VAVKRAVGLDGGFNTEGTESGTRRAQRKRRTPIDRFIPHNPRDGAAVAFPGARPIRTDRPLIFWGEVLELGYFADG